MGISGLLPALKAIQVIKPLSEFSGKIIAVDAYVWLHKGVYSCATELATGKSTHKYVDYAMHRVRLLRHHGIEPYIVFDGGPLPAKKGTEKERKQKREESRARGKALLAQGDSQQARDHFIKCVDVTPEMAYQLIKSLRAEAVSYVVAPYEADAQLAYLERTGIVDAILTEDSDLLVFGCQTVLFKLDAVASTVMSISRKDFGSVTATSGDPSGISLLGWSDTQFRAMTILSGCDYLPSIPGIGLKTACNLLRKWKTPEQVIRAVAMEGKKSVPPDYLTQFRLAEKCFLHQRVYCPKAERLVHLTDVGDDWDADFDAYVGSDMDPVLAKNIAIGAANPDTYLPMKDINKDFKPRALKALVPISNNPAKSLKAQGKMRESLLQSTKTPRKVSTPGKATAGGILNFFGPNPVIPPRTKQKTPIHQKSEPNITGKASGKRTLTEIMDQDMESKKKPRQSYPPVAIQSKFFSSVTASTSQRRQSAGSSQARQHEKENISLEYDEDAGDCLEEASELDLDGSDLSLRANFDAKAEREMDLDLDDFPDAVKQEDGYISPSPPYSEDADELSSPIQASRFPSPPKKQGKSTGASTSQDVVHTGFMPSDDEDGEDNSFGADFISSPVSTKRPRTFNFRAYAFQTPVRWSASKSTSPGSRTGKVLVGDTPAPLKKGIYPDIDEVPSPTHFHGPDLRSMLGGYNDTELELEDHLTPDQYEALFSNSVSSAPPSPSPETPALPPYMRQNEVQVVIDVDDFEDEDEQTVREGEDRAKAVMIGWRERWALPSGKKQMATVSGRGTTNPTAKGLTPGSRAMQMKRSETNVTPSGLHSLVKVQPRSAPPKFDGIHDRANTSYSAPNVKKNAAKPRRSLVFYEAVKQTNGSNVTVAKKGKKIVDLTLSSDFEDEIIMLV